MSHSTRTKPKQQVQSTSAQRFLQLANTLQFIWFSGHLVVVLSTPLYLLTFSDFLYRAIYVAVLESFGIILYQQYYLKTHSINIQAIKSSLFNDENFFYFILASIWLFMPQSSITVLPYFIFSLFHGLRYLESVFLPKVFLLNETNSWIIRIKNFSKDYNERCMYWVASIELLILVQSIFKALFWYKNSWIGLIIYSIFIKVRYENSKYLTSVFSQWRVRLDGIISHPSIPPAVKRTYNTLKLKLIQISKYQVTPRGAHSSASTSSSTDKKAI
ncbi:pore membrane protein of 33 kDa [Monosporozyma unispora]|nr:hypothetical protein C6P44_004391 [Kazachstania unispora]